MSGLNKTGQGRTWVRILRVAMTMLVLAPGVSLAESDVEPMHDKPKVMQEGRDAVPLTEDLVGQSTACVDDLRIDVLPLTWTENFKRSTEELRQMQSVLNRVGGLVSARFAVAGNVSISEAGCRTFSLRVGYEDVVLHVARELKADQCAFDHVFEHEMEHIRIYQRHLEGIEDRIRGRLMKHPGWASRHGAPAYEVVREAMKLAMQELDAVMVEHNRLDSPEEYGRNAIACEGGVLRLIAARYGRRR